MSCQYTQALLSSVTQEQTTHWWALRIPRLCFVIVTQEQTTHWWAVSIPRLCCHILHKNKLQTGELSEYPGLVVICDTRTKYSLMSCQDTQALLSSVTPEQTTHWWAVNIPRLCCHIWHKNKLLTGELSIYPGLIVICDTRTNYSLVSCQYTQALLSSVTGAQTIHWWAVSIPRLCCHLWHKNILLTGELSIYPGFVVICDTRTNYSLVSCQYTQALWSSVTQEQTTNWWAVRIPRTNYTLVSCQYTQAVLSSVTREQTNNWWAVSIPRTNYSLVSWQYTEALLSSVTWEQTAHWWAVKIHRLCCHLWHENKLLIGELSRYLGFAVICDTRTYLTSLQLVTGTVWRP